MIERDTNLTSSPPAVPGYYRWYEHDTEEGRWRKWLRFAVLETRCKVDKHLGDLAAKLGVDRSGPTLVEAYLARPST